MSSNFQVKTQSGGVITDPPIARFLFSDTRFSVVWLVVRVLLGWQWLSSGWGKLQNPAWVQTGDALKGYWTNQVRIPETGKPPIAFDWYRGFLQGLLDSGAYTWFAKLVVFGEIAVGIALIVGMFVGVAAFFGGFMNWNFIMAGSASTNGLLFAAALLLVLAWKTAGWYGADRYLLPRLGTPWRTRREADPLPTKSPQPAPATR
jgi:thiosulfate dehydrogenase (quinone) large subunit